MVEHPTLNRQVEGSSPSWPTLYINIVYLDHVHLDKNVYTTYERRFNNALPHRHDKENLPAGSLYFLYHVKLD